MNRESPLLRRIRVMTALFILGLVLSGVTAQARTRPAVPATQLVGQTA